MLPLNITDLSQTGPRDYHWSPANQRAFLEHLAVAGSVKLAAKHVAMSARAAYDLRYRREGAAFKLGWAAAVLIARGRLGDDLLERAIHGYDEEYVRSPADENGEIRICRHRTDSRLGMKYLKRLDQMADNACQNAGEQQLAQIIMSDWQAFLDHLAPIEETPDGLCPQQSGAQHGGGLAAVACYLAARDNRANPLSGLWQKPDEECEVAQFSAGLVSAGLDAGDGDSDGDAAELSDENPTPEQHAAVLSVWHCADQQDWRTDFPPPEDYDGDEVGRFGEDGYERTLTGEEERIQNARQTVALQPLCVAGADARERWFSGEAAVLARAEMAKEAAQVDALVKAAQMQAAAQANLITAKPVEPEDALRG